jgi:hypothetical protein
MERQTEQPMAQPMAQPSGSRSALPLDRLLALRTEQHWALRMVPLSVSLTVRGSAQQSGLPSETPKGRQTGQPTERPMVRP